MEIRRLSVCLAFLLVAAISHCTGKQPENNNSKHNVVKVPVEARHSVNRRDTKYDDDDLFLSDGTDPEQNDAENADYKEAPEEDIEANIITRPAKYNVTVGWTVRLECKIDHNETVVSWRKGDVDIVVNNFVAHNTNKYTFDLQTSDLIIHSVAADDSGVYRCTVVQNKPVSVEHSLLVTELPKIISFTASDGGRPREGSDLVLTCNVTGSPFPKIIWSKEGDKGNAHLTEKDGEFSRNSVVIRKVTKAHSGKYYCYAVNGVGSDTQGLVIVVLGTPHIHLHRTVVNSAVNVEATLQCSVHEEPPVKIAWYKNGEVVSPTGKTIINTWDTHSNLTVIPESDDDFGTYTCQAECAIGKHSRSVELVQRPIVENLEADGAKLAWRVNSHQELLKIELQLRDVSKDGDWRVFLVPVPETRNHEYELSYLVDESHLTSGKYEAVIKVQNTKDWSEPATTFVNIAEQQQIIQGASVLRGNDAVISRPATVLLPTTLMYLLVRML